MQKRLLVPLLIRWRLLVHLRRRLLVLRLLLLFMGRYRSLHLHGFCQQIGVTHLAQYGRLLLLLLLSLLSGIAGV